MSLPLGLVDTTFPNAFSVDARLNIKKKTERVKIKIKSEGFNIKIMYNIVENV